MTEPSQEKNLWNGNADPSAEYMACAGDPAYFCDRYCVIDDTQGLSGETTGTTRFRLWPAQIKVFYTLLSHRMIVMLKARQLGISWVVCAYVLWAACFKTNQMVLMFSKGQLEANELLRRIKAMRERLPESLRALMPQKVGESKREVKFSNGSVIRSMPATKSSGVSWTASILVIDEAAHIVHAMALMSSVKPTIDAGGQMIIFSTANGVRGMFHSIWQKATAGTNGFVRIFLPWWARPDRTRAFLEKIRSEEPDPRIVPQNYPENPTEAFIASGRTRFEPDWLLAQARIQRSPTPARELPHNLIGVPGLRLYIAPQVGKKYLVCSDIAEGIVDGTGDPDYSAGFVLDVSDPSRIAVCSVIHGRWETDTYAGYLMQLASWYGGDHPQRKTKPEILVERNNHGHAILSFLRTAHYPAIARGHDGKPGWLTNEVTREPAVNALASYLRDGAIVVNDEGTISELQSFHVNQRGVSCADRDSHDDLVMGLVVGLGYLNHAMVKKHAQTTVRVDSPMAGYRG